MNQLVFLHGFLGCAGDWDAVRHRIAKTNSTVHCEAIELPMADDWHAGVKRLVEELPNDSILVGYSMGARLALGCALSGSAKVRGLVFISGNPGIEAEEREARLQHDLQVANRLSESDFESFLTEWYCQPIFAGLTDNQAKKIVHRRLQLNRARHANLLRAYSVARQPNFWPNLETLDVPTLLVAGERDRKYSMVMRRAAKLTQRCELKIIHESGHIVHLERPDILASSIIDFTNRISERPVHV